MDSKLIYVHLAARIYKRANSAALQYADPNENAKDKLTSSNLYRKLMIVESFYFI